MKTLLVISITLVVAIAFIGCGTGKDEIVNSAPSDPYNPIPADGEVDVEMPVTIKWDCDDADGDELLFKVKLGDDPGSKRKYDPTADSSYTFDELEPGTTYYWSVAVEDGNGGFTDGPNQPNYWTFTTAGEKLIEETEDED